jgi:hypothetical protein
MTGKAWSHPDEVWLASVYPTRTNTELAAYFRRNARAIGMKARKMGLRKSPNLKSGQFTPGHETWNKGIAGSTGNHENSRKHQFMAGGRTGSAAQNYRAIGSELLGKDGVLLRKVSDTGVRRNDWRAVHALVWESVHGPIPAGYIVVFHAGKRTNVGSLITIDRVELITRAENMRRNSYLTRYPKGVADVIRLRGALNRKINNRSKRA